MKRAAKRLVTLEPLSSYMTVSVILTPSKSMPPARTLLTQESVSALARILEKVKMQYGSLTR